MILNKEIEYMNKILCIGDTHITNGQSLDRFKLASKYIMDERPSYIVIMGDFLTLACLSAWDRNKRKNLEGVRYWKELKAGNDALDLLFADMNKFNAKKKRSKTKQYRPKIIYLEGNHEDRLTRYFEGDPTFDGTISISNDLNLIQRGIEFVPYRQYYWINEIGFTHIPFNKIQAISGIDITRKASFVTVKSAIFAHTHELHTSNWHKAGQEHLQQITCVGCFFEEHELYVEGRLTQYWKGLVMLYNYKPSRYDMETTSIGRLRRKYSKDISTNVLTTQED